MRSSFITCSDGIALAVMHGGLLVVLLVSLAQTVLVGVRECLERCGGISVSATVKRGEQTMNGLYAMYAVATVIFSLAVQVAKPGHGHKTTLIAVDYIVLSYLFFFNSWFRNQVVIKLLERIKKD